MSGDRTRQLPDDGVRLILSRLDSLALRMNGLEERMTGLEQRMTGLEQRMTGLEQRMTGLEERMTALEEKVDRRLQETRPIWEQVLSHLDTIGYAVAGLDRKLLVFNEDLLRMRHRLDADDERLRRLEAETKP